MVGGPWEEEWRRWARATVGEADTELAAGTALRALRAGAGPTAAAAAGRSASGRANPAELEELRRARAEIESALQVLASARVEGELTPEALTALKAQLSARREALGPPAPGTAAPATVPPPAAIATRPRQFSSREFLADHSIQLLAYSGAFLAAVAVLLFDLSGSSSGRFYAVAALNLAFAMGGWVAFRRPELRVLAQSYLALAALLLPLTGLAAYIFLDLGPLGVSVSLGVAAAAAACALAYAALAFSLRSRLYAALSVTALPVSVAAALVWAGREEWAGVGVAALAPVLVVAAERSRRGLRTYALSAEVATYLVGGAGLIWSSSDIALDDHWHLTAALACTLLAGTLRVVLPRSWNLPLPSALPAVMVPALLLSLARDLSLSQAQGRVLTTLLALLAIGAAWPRRPPLDARNRAFLQALAAILLISAAILVDERAPLQAALLCAITAVGVVLALSSGRSASLFLPAVTFALAWYWLAKSLVPAPASPSSTDLARVYGPLAVLMLGAGLVARWVRGRSWAWPLYASAAAVAVGVVFLSLTDAAWTLAGLWLLLYAALTYGIGMLEGWWWAVTAALLGAAGGVAALLTGVHAPAWEYLVALSLSGLLSYGAMLVSSRIDRLRAAQKFQLWVARGEVLAAAAGGLALGNSTEEIAAGSFSVLLASALLGAEWWLTRELLAEYLAPVTLSLLGVFASRAAHLGDPQWYVAVPAVVLTWTGVRLSNDGRVSRRLAWGRGVTAAGALLLFGTTGIEAANGPEAPHVAWLAVEAAIGLAAAIAARSRSLMTCAALALATAAVLAAFLLAEATSLALVFGLVAGSLLVVATVLALLRSRLTGAGALARGSWDRWA
jgi:hypothetical protein